MQKNSRSFLLLIAVAIVTLLSSFSLLSQEQQPSSAVILLNDYSHYPFPPTAMDTFLAAIRPRLESEQESQVIIVSGNESADLDSVVSALTTSFFLSHSNAYPGNIVLPFINIPRIDLALRSDIVFLLETNHINNTLLFFRDDLPILERLAANNKLSLFLVDHNEVMGTMSSLNHVKVVGIIDHHADGGLYKDTANPRRIEPVGSCASLVADQFLKAQMEKDRQQNGGQNPSWVQQVTRLLLGPILIDTQDLKPERHKVKPLDLAMANFIFPYTGWESMEDLFHRIDSARRDTSRLSYYDLLRKDYKEWTVQNYETKEDVKVGISSVIGLMDKYSKRDSKEVMQRAVDEWAKNRSMDLAIVLLADDMGEGHGGYQRQVIVLPVTSKVNGFTGRLEGIPELQLERTNIIDTEDFVKQGGRAYLQHNNSCTRKQIWPWVEKLITLPLGANL